MATSRSEDTLVFNDQSEALTCAIDTIDQVNKDLRLLNRAIHDNPETAYQEFFAVKTISSFLRGKGFEVTEGTTYKDLRVNLPLCQQYVDDMRRIGERILVKDDESYTASTDMGNVSYEVPSFHGAFAVPTDSDVSLHHPRFAVHAGTDEAMKQRSGAEKDWLCWPFVS
ncbi:hypothetical protein LTS15_003119 [Exophiala xenobiotica]|nr:hypothetical protein LTS15_003119 [Exophiala xenobiotica]